MNAFGWCFGASGDRYHDNCRREFIDQTGVRHVCGCAQHETEENQ